MKRYNAENRALANKQRHMAKHARRCAKAQAKAAIRATRRQAAA